MGKGNPQAADNPAPKQDKRSKYVANSGAQMQSIRDLDRKAKYSAMITKSSVFDTTNPAPNFLGTAKNKSPHRR